MAEVVETVQFLGVFLYHLIVGMLRAVLPFKLLPVKNIAQEVVVVTGAGSGIGRLIAVKLGKLGGRMVLLDVNIKGNQETARIIQKGGGYAVTYKCDVSNRETVYSVAKQIETDVGNVDVLVNNAGIVNGDYFLNIEDDKLQRCMNINTIAHFWTVKAFLPAMKTRNYGAIVSIVSIAGISPGVKLADYCASKFGAMGFHESLSLELMAEGFDGIDTTVVCPWVINTGMFDGFKTKVPLLLPVLEPEYVAQKTVEALLIRQEVLFLPRILYVMTALNS